MGKSVSIVYDYNGIKLIINYIDFWGSYLYECFMSLFPNEL